MDHRNRIKKVKTQRMKYSHKLWRSEAKFRFRERERERERTCLGLAMRRERSGTRLCMCLSLSLREKEKSCPSTRYLHGKWGSCLFIEIRDYTEIQFKRYIHPKKTIVKCEILNDFFFFYNLNFKMFFF